MTEDKSPLERTAVFERKVKTKNDMISPLKGIEQLHGLSLELDSPMFRTACSNLGIFPTECAIK